jgi:prefoldin subunit 5
MGAVDPRTFGNLEAKVEHLTERIEKLEEAIGRLEGRISTLTALLDQARGVRIVLVVLMGCASFAAGIATAMRALK